MKLEWGTECRGRDGLPELCLQRLVLHLFLVLCTFHVPAGKHVVGYMCTCVCACACARAGFYAKGNGNSIVHAEVARGAVSASNVHPGLLACMFRRML